MGLRPISDEVFRDLTRILSSDTIQPLLANRRHFRPTKIHARKVTEFRLEHKVRVEI